jgi:hypothetical protein
MAMPRLFSLVDVGVITVIAVAVLLPAREMYAENAMKGDGPAQFGVALAEARTMARPDDGLALEDFTKKLGRADQKDWAIEVSVKGSERAKESPTRWRVLIAASVAFIGKLDVVQALDYANRALAACETAREKGNAAACPSWEEVRMRLYQQHLDAGVQSKIDPRLDPAGFRRAGEAALRHIYIGGRADRVPTPDGAGSGAAGSAAPAPVPAPGGNPAPTPPTP